MHHSTAEMAIPSLDVKQGDTIDFIVDFRENLNSDMFKWAPVISEQAPVGSSAAETLEGDMGREKGIRWRGNPDDRSAHSWEQLAQVLLLANEFSFID